MTDIKEKDINTIKFSNQSKGITLVDDLQIRINDELIEGIESTTFRIKENKATFNIKFVSKDFQEKAEKLMHENVSVAIGFEGMTVLLQDYKLEHNTD